MEKPNNKKVYAGSGNDFQKTADRVSAVSITGNLVLSVFKLIAAIAAHSNAMISDAVHSAYTYVHNQLSVPDFSYKNILRDL